jgi:plasmid stability protein
MNEIRIPPFDPKTTKAIRRRARLRGKSFEDEIRELVEMGLLVDPRRAEIIQRFRDLRSGMPPQKTDSVDLIREDRDR